MLLKIIKFNKLKSVKEIDIIKDMKKIYIRNEEANYFEQEWAENNFIV